MKQLPPLCYLKTLVLGLLVGCPVLFFAQNGWQETYPDANGFNIGQLVQTGNQFSASLKNGTNNAVLNGSLTDGSQLDFNTTAPDCGIGTFGGLVYASPFDYLEINTNANEDLEIKRVKLVTGDCGTVEQLYFDETYELLATTGTNISGALLSTDGQAFFVAGNYTVSTPSGPPMLYYFALKINANTGQESWRYTEEIGFSSFIGTAPSPRVALSDGGVALLLPSTSQFPSKLWRLDGNGIKLFGDVSVSDFEVGVLDIMETTDGNLFVRSALLGSGGSGPFSLPWNLKIDMDGNTVFSNSPAFLLGNELNDFVTSISSSTGIETNDGGFLLSGTIATMGGFDGLYFLKLDNGGGTVWVKFYDGLKPNFSASIQTSDGGFLFGGYLSGNVYFMKTNADGEFDTPPSTCTNLLVNPGFEDGLADWNSTGNVGSSADAQSGSSAGEICGIPGSLTQVFGTQAGKTYTAKVAGKISGNPQSASALLRFLDAGFAPLSGQTSNSQAFTSTDYQTIELNATAPAGASFVQLLIYKESNGCLVVDDAELCEGGGGGTGGGGMIDLEISLNQPNANPAQYSNYEVNLTISNTSTEAASGVQVSFAKPAGVVYTGGNEFTVSQGSFNPFGNEVWTVGNLDAGTSATLTVGYFLLETEAPAAYAQVIAADQTDTDSTPGNGTPPSANEDDEANTSGGGGTGLCADFMCFDPIFFNPEFCPGNFAASAFMSGNVVGGSGNYAYLWSNGQTGSFASQLDTGSYAVTVTDIDFGCTCERSVNIPFYTLPFDLTLTQTTAPSGPTTADGTFEAEITNTSSILEPYTISWSGGPDVTTFDNVTTFSGITAGTYVVTAQSSTFGCEVTKEIEITTGGTGGGGDIDLSLEMSTNQPNPNIYSSTSVLLTVSNAGPETATNVVIEFQKPDNVAYEGGNEWVTSQGSFFPYGNQQWTVGNLLPGNSAAISVNYFVLTDNALTPYAQVTFVNESDGDSTPGNGSCCTPNEDDEATLTLNALSGGGGIALLAQEQKGRPVQLRAISPNPVYFGETVLTIMSSLDGLFELECFDLYGRLALSQKVELRQGHNRLNLDVSQLESGTYYLNMPGQNWRNMPIRFVVARW